MRVAGSEILTGPNEDARLPARGIARIAAGGNEFTERES